MRLIVAAIPAENALANNQTEPTKVHTRQSSRSKTVPRMGLGHPWRCLAEMWRRSITHRHSQSTD